jgi:Cellulase (glycosyl hydrolase family 5)
MRAFVLVFLLALLPFSNIPAMDFGIGTGVETDQIADKASELGATWIRLTFVWRLMEPDRDVFDWRVSDQQVARARDRGLKICAILSGTPKWANGGRSEQTPPRDPRDWVDFVQSVSSHYRFSKTIRAYEIWNEPNLKNFWNGKPRDYIEKILIPGAQAVRKGDPDALVVAPALSHHWTTQSDWALGNLMHAAADQIDIVAVHYYPDANVPLDRYLDQWVSPSRMGKPVWITEIGEVGCSSKKGTLEKQSTAYESFLQTILERSEWITNVFPYRLWDPRDQCDKQGNGYGLTTGDPAIKRPAFQTYHDFIKKHESGAHANSS